MLNTYVTCIYFNGPQINPFICLGLEEKKIQTHNLGLESKQNWNSGFHKAQQIAVCRDAVEQLSSHGIGTASRWIASY